MDKESINEVEERLDKVNSDNEEPNQTNASNYKPWNDKDSKFYDKAQERMDELPIDVREHVSAFNLDAVSAEKILEQIPIEIRGKSKYTRLNIQQMYDIVSKTGQYKFIYDEFDIITRSCLSGWLKKYPEFLYLMLKAKENFRKSNWEVNPDLERKAVEALDDAVSGRRQRVQKIITEDEEGNKRKKIIQTDKPPAKWAIEKIIGDEENRTDGGGKNQVTELTLEE